MFLYMDNTDSDQTAHKHWLILVSVGRRYHKVCFLMSGFKSRIHISNAPTFLKIGSNKKGSPTVQRYNLLVPKLSVPQTGTVRRCLT